MAQIVSIQSIQVQARQDARNAAEGVRVHNPYSVMHPAHDKWQEAFDAALAALKTTKEPA